jgi:hypothetical protein
MEFIVKTISTYHRGVAGCKRHGKDVMIAFTQENETQPHAVHDMFLSQEQAIALMANLATSIAENNSRGS